MFNPRHRAAAVQQDGERPQSAAAGAGGQQRAGGRGHLGRGAGPLGRFHTILYDTTYRTLHCLIVGFYRGPGANLLRTLCSPSSPRLAVDATVLDTTTRGQLLETACLARVRACVRARQCLTAFTTPPSCTNNDMVGMNGMDSFVSFIETCLSSNAASSLV